MQILQDISTNLQAGRAKAVRELVQQALDQGIAVKEILEKGLLEGMGVIGGKFRNNEVYVPEVLMAARAMNQGVELLKPHYAESGVKSVGRVCIGTVKGDLHDIGKNLVKMMLEGKGFEVIDLGTDVPAETFISTIIEKNCAILCLSALLTTTMAAMADVVKKVEAAGIRNQVKIMVGGAPVTDEFRAEIGADAYAPDAASAADTALKLLRD
jgi:corrinoid protein of di/trimethylamine methyltransferase